LAAAAGQVLALCGHRPGYRAEAAA
jgi:hypothetical protein